MNHHRIGIGVAAGWLGLARMLASQTVTEFAIPTANSGPGGIAAGPDGNLWFTETGASRIGRITTAGGTTEFPSHTASGGIAAGPDGNLWFTEPNKIGRITTAGVITEFPIPTASSGPGGIAAGSDGNLWFTESAADKIGRITTAGVMTEFSLPSASSQPFGIAAGPDGNLWFTEFDRIGRITTAGVITEFPIPTSGSGAVDIAVAPDGNLWFTEANANNIGRITTAGVITEFPIPRASSGLGGIAAGPDGNLWFTEFAAQQIGRITTAGVITEFALVGPGCYDIGNSGACNPKPYRIAAGPDGNLWFTIAHINRIGRIITTIGRINTGAACVANDTTLCLSASRFMVTADFETQDGQSGAAHAVTLTSDTGYFWFFDPTNVEVVTKILPYCADPFNSIWIFAAGLTNMKVELTYTDTKYGSVVTKKNELGVPFAPVQDTSAFKRCP